MRRGWQVELKDGTIINEGKIEWKDVPKKDIARLSMLYDGRQWNIVGKDAYFVKHRASVVPGDAASFRVEKRTVGYYDAGGKVCYTVDELTGQFKLEVVSGKNA